jgi:hypothetical protein
MKWIKTFEELTPSIYRRAGSKLNNIEKSKRGDRLIDYGSEKEWGLYNMWAGLLGQDITKCEFTKPHAKLVICTSDLFDISIEEMFDMWLQGERELYFSIVFSFTLTNNEENTRNSYLRFTEGTSIPLFSFKVHLADHTDGEKEDLQTCYEWYKELTITLQQPEERIYKYSRFWSHYKSSTGIFNGVFSDRQSALRFKRQLPNLINDDIRDKIWEIFSLLGVEADEFTHFMKSIEDPSVNQIFRAQKPNQNIFKDNYLDIIQYNRYEEKPVEQKLIEPPKQKVDTITTTSNITPVYKLKEDI